MQRERSRPRKTDAPQARYRFPIDSRDLGLAALLLGLMLFAYLPALNGGYIWDDNAHITRPDLQSLHGLWRIWFELGATQQYYPLLHSAFWIEHQMWGDSVFGYHLLNVALHAVSALLLVLLMRRLALPGAWLAGFLFALHPVCVESVAWISEQKNTLSGVFYLASALIYLRFDQTRRRAHYSIALALFVAALLSKSVTATLPAALLVILWWRRGRLDWKKDALPLAPWLAIGAAAGLFTSWVERKYIGAQGAHFSMSLLERCLLAGRVIWFYLAKLVWPANLMFVYPHWNISAAVWWQYLFPVGALALAAALWIVARRHRGPLAAYLYFVGTLVPVLGFLNVYPFVFSYVADHFQYLATLGVIVPAAYGLTLAAKRAAFVPAIAVAALAILSWQQSGTYRDGATLYQDTLARNSESWMAHNELGLILTRVSGAQELALAHIQEAVRLYPDSAEVHNNLGVVLSDMPGRLPDAVTQFQTALRIKPKYAEAHNNLGGALSELPGRKADAMAEYQAALSIDPNDAEARNNLGSALSEMPGRLPDAIAEFEAALRINPNLVEAQANLGAALAKVPGRRQEAIAHLQTALQIRPDLQRVRQMLAQLSAAQQ